MPQEYYIPVPLTQAIKEWSDQELVEIISTTEFRLEKNKYEVNEAALCLYDTAKTEWVARHGNKPCPRIIAPTEFVFEGDIYAETY